MSADDRTRWDAKYRERGPTSGEPDPFLLEAARLPPGLPTAGRALDVAGGAGRHALWLARRGLDVTVCDVSPVGLDLAAAAAAEAGLELSTRLLDLEEQPLPTPPPSTAGGWDLILCFHFLHRPLFAAIPAALSPGGLFLFCQPTRKNLERHPHPSARFLLEQGELARLVPPGLEVVHLEEGWSERGRHEARLIARGT